MHHDIDNSFSHFVVNAIDSFCRCFTSDMRMITLIIRKTIKITICVIHCDGEYMYAVMVEQHNDEIVALVVVLKSINNYFLQVPCNGEKAKQILYSFVFSRTNTCL